MCKVQLILVDGMRPDSLEACGNPYVKTLLENSLYTLDAKTVMPSVTLPCHMSLFHSVDPARHGITTNTYMPQVRPIDGLVERLKGKAKCGMFYNWEELRDLTRPGSLTCAAKKYGKVNCVASSEADNYTRIPELDKSRFDPDADYFYITTNNTIFGTRYDELPDTGDVPLVADMSSNIMSEVYDINRFGVAYAGAQKNIGPAGFALVIVRKDLFGRALPITPKILNWEKEADKDSMINTPPTYAIYMAGLCMKWLKSVGGVPAIEKINIEKASMLYDALDNSSFYKPVVTMKQYRSRMNVTFNTPSKDLDAEFAKEAAANGLANLKGHRLVGGIRASIYNAMPVEGVKALIEFMKKFEMEHK